MMVKESYNSQWDMYQMSHHRRIYHHHMEDNLVGN
jgi:hypothetical protein